MTHLRGPADADHYRVQVGRYRDRWYVDPLPSCPIAEATDAQWPSVTTVKKGAGGQDWTYVGLKRVAQALEDKPDALAGLDYGSRYDRLISMNKQGLARAGTRGTNVHTYFEMGLRGQSIEATLPGEPGAEYLDAVRAFFDQYQPELVAAEVVAINRTLNGVGYGGTGDAIIRIDGKTYWPDWKSRGEESNHGAYPEEAAQVGAYAMADYIIVELEDGPQRILIPDLDGGLIVSVKPDGCRIYPVDLRRAAEHWRLLHFWWSQRQNEREAIGKPWAPRSISTPRQLGKMTLVVPEGSSDQVPDVSDSPPSKKPDPGPSLPARDFDKFNHRFRELGEGERLWLDTLLNEAAKAGTRIAGQRHARNKNLIDGLLKLAERHCDDNDLVREIVATVLDHDGPFSTPHTVGAWVGSLNADEAAHFNVLCKMAATAPEMLELRKPPSRKQKAE